MIDASRLIAAGVPAASAPALAAACEHYMANTPARVAGLVAQCRVETGEFSRWTEDLFYTHAQHIVDIFPHEVPTLAAAAPLAANPRALANAVYANRLGNGDAASGDGWAYRGAGAPMLTGRNEFAAAQAALGRPYLAHPELVQTSDAFLVAAWYWFAHGCNDLADAHEWDAITRIWNGPAMLQAPRRAALSQSLLTELSA